MKTAVVIAFERLPLRRLGCYGCLPSPTPHIDRFAAESVVFDRYFAENADPEAENHAWWTGRCQFPIPHADQRRQPEALFEQLAAAGVEVVGIGEPASTSTTIPHSRTVSWNAEPTSSGSRKVFQKATDCFSDSRLQCDKDKLLWVLSSELGVAADAREAAAEKRIRAIDDSVGRFFQSLKDSQRSSCSELLLIVTAAAGMLDGTTFPESLPQEFRRLAECNVHTPLIVQSSGRRSPGWLRRDASFLGRGGQRQSSLVQTVDLAPTLLEWFGVSSEGVPCDGQSLLPLLSEDVAAGGRDTVCFGDGLRCCGIRTRDFCLMSPQVEVTSAAGGNLGDSTVVPANVRLFVKPDDPWEMHNVAEQEPETVGRLLERLRGFVAQRTSR